MGSRSFFLLVVLFFALAHSETCTVDTSNFNDDISDAFQDASHCQNIIINITRVATCKNDLVGSNQTLVIEGNEFTLSSVHLSFSSFFSIAINNLKLDGGDRRPIMLFSNSPVTVQNCYFSGSKDGSILSDSNIYVYSSQFYLCSSGSADGGAINTTSDVEVYDSVFDSNTAPNGRGGAISANNIVIVRSNFTSNSARQAGALNAIGTCNITQSAFIDNSAPDGAGAIHAFDLDSRNNRYELNQARLDGGCIVTEGDTFSSEDSFIGNTARDGSGSAIKVIGRAHILKGYFLQNQSPVGHGAVFGSGPFSFFDSCSFVQNYASDGTGVYVEYGNVTIINSVFDSNTAESLGFIRNTAAGAAISVFDPFSPSVLHLENSNFTSNNAVDQGGALNLGFAQSDIINCLFLNNSASKGGAIFVAPPQYEGAIVNAVSIYQSNFTLNYANTNTDVFSLYDSGTGGAISGVLVGIFNSTFFGNVAGSYGGAVYSHNIITESTHFELNSAISGGVYAFNPEDIYIYLEPPVFKNCTSVGNQASQRGGAIWAHSFLSNSSLFANNYSPLGGAIYGTDITSFGSRFEGNSAGKSGGAIYSSYLFTDGTVFKNNSAMRSGGGALVGGQVSIANSEFENNEAQVDGGGISLISFDEGDISSNNLYINNVTTLNNRAKNNGGCISILKDLDGLIVNNLYSNGDSAGGNGGAFSLFSLSPSINISVSNVSSVNCSASLGGSWFISGTFNEITFRNSKWENNTSTEFSGGAVAIRSTCNRIDFEDCEMIGNHANFQGGAVVQQDTAKVSDLTLERVIIQNNSAGSGGTFTLRGSIDNLNMMDSIISGNNGTMGAGLEMNGMITQANINNSIFSRNQVDLGGAIHAVSNERTLNLRVENSEFIQNSAYTEGGAVWIGKNVNSSFEHSQFTSNVATLGGAAVVQVYSMDLPVFEKCNFSSNVANEGGAIFATFLANSNISFVKDCNFVGNRANDGGAIALKRQLLDFLLILPSNEKRSSSPTTFENLSFTNNNAINSGGALSATGDVLLVGSSFSGNSAKEGNSIAMQNGTLTLSGSSLGQSQVYLSPSSTLIGDSGSNDVVSCPTGQHVVADGNGVYYCIADDPTSVSPVVIYVENSRTNVALIVGLCVGIGGFVLIVIIAAAILLYRRRQQAKLQANSFSMVDLSQINLGEAKKSIIDFDNIKIDKEIGAGAFGVVYKAEWRELTVAVKQVRSEHVTSSQLKDFLQEVAILKGLRSHPNVVLFLGITFPPQPLSLVTEYCEGGSLALYLRTNSVSNETKLTLIQGIAKGMLHLHHEGVIHRDLAVRNILLSKHLEPKVADFGLSRQHSDSENAATTNTDVGPLKWMSPESILHQQYSIKSDVFSFGVVIWEILEQKDPWQNVSPMEAALKVATEGKRMEIPANIDPKLDKLMRECWQTDPAQRPNFAQICAWLNDSHDNSQMLDMVPFVTGSTEKDKLDSIDEYGRIGGSSGESASVVLRQTEDGGETMYSSILQIKK